MTKKLVIYVDTLFDFMMKNGRLPVPGAEEIIPDLIRFTANLAPEETEAVLFLYDTHTEKEYIGSPENLGDPENGVPGFPLHCEKGTPGWVNVINPALVPTGIPVYTMEKNVFGMWWQDGLMLEGAYTMSRDNLFYNLKKKGIDTVVVVGVAADFCVKWAIDGLVERGFNVEVPAALTRGIIDQIEEVCAKNFSEANVKVV